MTADQLGKNAADADHHQRPRITITTETDDYFGNAFLHALYQYAIQLRFRQRTADTREHAIDGVLQPGRILNIQRHATDLGLVRNINRKNFCHRRKDGAHRFTAILHHLRCCKRNTQCAQHLGRRTFIERCRSDRFQCGIQFCSLRRIHDRML